MTDLASEVRIENEAPKAPTINASVRTILLALGVTEMGPTDGTTRKVTSIPEYERLFGGWTTNSKDMRAALQGWWAEAGEGAEAHVGRVVHTSVQGDPTTKTSTKGQLTLSTPTGGAVAGSVLSGNPAPYNLEPGDTLVISRDALGQATATVTATAATRSAGVDGPYALADNQTIIVSIDGGAPQTVTFLASEFANIGAATATEVAAVIAAKLVGAQADVSASRPRIRSDRRGTSSGVNVSGGTANAVLQYTTGNSPGTGNVANVDAVTAAEVKTIVEAAVSGVTVTNEGGFQRISSNTTGPSSSVQVISTSTADDEFDFDNVSHPGNAAGAQQTVRVDARWDGAYAAEITVQVTAATNGLADHFNFYVLRNGLPVERYANLNLDELSPRYALTIINPEATGSRFVVLVDLNATIASPGNLPIAGTFGPLTGGSDGLVGLTDTDYVGGVTLNGKTGLRCFDSRDGDILIVPGRATAAVQNAEVTYCEVTREGLLFPILDPPAGLTAAQMETYFVDTAALYELSELGSMYWPRVKILNPAKAVYGNDADIVVPPSGVLAGIYARVDESKIGGAFEHPAGEGELYRPTSITGVETDEVFEKAARDRLFPRNINPISKEGKYFFVDGARVLKLTGNWPSVGQRRGVMFVSKRLKTGLTFLRHRNMRPSFYQAGIRTTTVFMNLLTRNDCFASKKPSEAYQFDFGPGLNKPSTRKQRKAISKLAMATTEPGEFIVVLVGPDTRALDAELAAEAAG
ncbi:MAG: phage tail protein [Polyangiaceae bacterium]|nr:phage tail protein [Polyangiaceae bacterium]